MRKIIYLNIGMILFIIGCKSDNLVNPILTSNDKPDLIIDEITYKRLPDCHQGYPSGIICDGPTFEFTLRVKNIGATDVTSALFITNSTSQWDFDNQYCSYGQRLNDPPTNIPTNGSIDIKLESHIDEGVQKIFFVLDTYDRTNSGLNLPKVDELSYDNNTLVVDLEW
jgi:hypothetical protein